MRDRRDISRLLKIELLLIQENSTSRHRIYLKPTKSIYLRRAIFHERLNLHLTSVKTECKENVENLIFKSIPQLGN